MGVLSSIGDLFAPLARGFPKTTAASTGGGFSAGRFLFGPGERRVMGQGFKRSDLMTSTGLSGSGGVLHRTLPGKMLTAPGIGGLTGALLKHALPRFGIAAGVDAYLNTPRGEEMSGAARFGLQAASFGLKFGAYRHLARGAIGSVLGRAGYAMGNRNKFYDQYDWASKKLGAQQGWGLTAMTSAFSKESLTGKAMRGAGKLARNVAWAPVKMAAGIPYAAVQGARTVGRLAGIGNTPIGNLLTARMTPWNKVNRFGERIGFLNKEHHAPIMYGAVSLGIAAGGMLQNKKIHDERRNWIPGNGYNPANYGRGMSAMRRGPAMNYGPALTLQLHQRSSRVMP